MTPYYDDGQCVIYHGDCREIECSEAWALVTDPPYPNNAGHFDDAVPVAREVLRLTPVREALIFWTELEYPPVALPLVAVHIWHRSNVNGRPYEPVFHSDALGVKRRSEVMRHPAIFNGAGPGCQEYLGHPTQKPVALMRQLIAKTAATTIFDPFMGSGSTLRAAMDLSRRAIGVEVDERYCEIAANRLAQQVLAL
jgi:DNA modification methylase